jgi:hypothetical protein
MSGLTNLAGIGNTNNAAVADTGANAAALAGGVNASATLGQNNIWGKAITDTGNQQSIQGTLGKIFGNAVTGSNSTPAVPGSTDSYIAANADPNYAIDPLPQFSMGGA